MKLLTPRDELGEALHTALRKFGDSKATSLTWNIIDLLTTIEVPRKLNQSWKSFLDLAWNELQKPGLTKENTTERLKSAANQLPIGCPAKNSLRLSFYFFDDDDWQAFIQLLQFEN